MHNIIIRLIVVGMPYISYNHRCSAIHRACYISMTILARLPISILTVVDNYDAISRILLIACPTLKPES